MNLDDGNYTKNRIEKSKRQVVVWDRQHACKSLCGKRLKVARE